MCKKSIVVGIVVILPVLSCSNLKAESRNPAETEQQHELRCAGKRAVLEADEALFARGETRVYKGEHLEALDFTIGGIGAGCIRFDGRGRLQVWQIFNNMTQASVPHSFFAIYAKPKDDQAVMRALQTEAAGPFRGMENLSFRGEYPLGWYDFEDTKLSVRVEMEVYNPLIPLELKKSSIPCVIYNFTVSNNSKHPVDIGLLASQQNAVGFAGEGEIKDLVHENYGGNVNKIIRDGSAVILHMSTTKPQTERGYGDMVLAAVSDSPEKVTSTSQWSALDALKQDFEQDGQLDSKLSGGPTSEGCTLNGALAVSETLKPGEKKRITYVTTWYFPNGRHGTGKWGGEGNMYSNWWKDALEVSAYVRDNLPKLDRLTKLYHDIFYQTNLPYWMLDRITSQTAILKSKTCFWDRSGYIGGWEGCNSKAGCCFGNASHVWGYAQAQARLFPELSRRMTEEALDTGDKADGRIPIRQPYTRYAFDGQCSYIMSAYREYLMSEDKQWLVANWGKIKKAMDYAISSNDKDEDGFLSGLKWGLDSNHSGCGPWMGLMYLGALAASEKMALICGDGAAAQRYRKIMESGRKKQNEALWNGEYYIQFRDSEDTPASAKMRDYGRGCHIDQMLGQWWAQQLNLGWIYPRDRVRTALKSLYKYNFKSDFYGLKQIPRKFVVEEDAGLRMTTWPNGPRPVNHILFADEVMSGFEYTAAAAMIYAGLLKEPFVVVKAAAHRYDGKLRTGLAGAGLGRAAWGYSGNAYGDDECGKFYSRAMSAWSMLLACQGFIYDGPAGLIGFKPRWKPEDHRSFFTAATGWGLFSQKRDSGWQTMRLEAKYGRLKIAKFIGEIAEGKSVTGVSVTHNGKRLDADYELDQREISIRLSTPVAIDSGSNLEIIIR